MVGQQASYSLPTTCSPLLCRTLSYNTNTQHYTYSPQRHVIHVKEMYFHTILTRIFSMQKPSILLTKRYGKSKILSSTLHSPQAGSYCYNQTPRIGLFVCSLFCPEKSPASQIHALGSRIIGICIIHTCIRLLVSYISIKISFFRSDYSCKLDLSDNKHCGKVSSLLCPDLLSATK